MKPLSHFPKWLTAGLLLLLISLAGCGGGSSGSSTAVSAGGTVDQGPISGTTTASALLQFDLSGQTPVLPRIADQATAFRVTVYQANGEVVKNVNSGRVASLLIDGLPAGRVLLRTEFLDAAGQVIGHLDRFTSLTAGRTAVLGLTGFVPGPPSPGIPSFPGTGGVPSRLLFQEFPSTVTPGTPFHATVLVLDTTGAPMPSAVGTVTLSVQNALLAGRTSSQLSQGAAAFTGLTLDSQGGSVVLRASASISGQTLEGTSLPVFLEGGATPPSQGVPATLRFATFPESGIAGQAITAVTVEVLDIYGRRVSTSGQVVTLSLSQNPVPPDGAVLSGALSRPTSQGLAAFTGLELDRAGSYRFFASTPDVIGASSEILKVTSSPPQPPAPGSGFFDGLLVMTRVGSGYSYGADYPRDVLSADFDGDGRDDLVTIDPAGVKREIIFAAGVGDGTFEKPVAFPTSLNMSTAAFGDLDGDGDLDLAATSFESGGVVRVYLNDGAGVFSEQSALLASQSGCFEIVLEDFDGDDLLDIATANRDAGSATVFLNQGAGVFSAGVHIPVAGSPVGIAAADLDGDDDIDLVTANVLSGNVTLLENNGGVFTVHGSQSMGAGAFGLALVDIDGDNRPDLVTADRDANTISIRLNQGNFNFSVPERIPVGGLPYDVAAADLNGDGRLDLATANFSDHSSTVLLNTESGWEIQEVPTGAGPIALALRDFDRDGSPDLATANYRECSVLVRLNDGSGSFRLPTTVGEGPFYSVLSGDMNGDGLVDLVAQSMSREYTLLPVTVLLGRGDGTFPEALANPVGLDLISARLIDFDADGDLDLVGLSPSVSTMVFAVCFNNGLGELSEPVTIDVGGTEFYAVGDVNGDGLPDLVASSFVGSLVSVYLNDGSGILNSSPVWTASGVGSDGVELGDFDGDGVLDLVYREANVVLCLGVGDGTFGSATILASHSGGYDFRVGDLNGDGNLDIVGYSAGGLTRYLNNGDATFLVASYATAASPTDLMLKDINGDGHLDAVTTDSGAYNSTHPQYIDSFTIFLGDGTGTLTEYAHYRTGSDNLTYSARGIASGDFDQDGDLDIVGVDRGANALRLFLNR